MALYVGYTQADPASGENVNSAYKLRASLGAGLHKGALNLANRAGVIGPVGAMSVASINSMNVSVNIGQCIIPSAGSGTYTVTSDAGVTVPIEAAGGSARFDLIIARVYDTEVGDTAPSRARIEVVKGTTTTDPAIPARSLVLARVTVGAGVTSITSANIADLRKFTAAAGGIVPVVGAASETALGTGAVVFDTTTNRLGVSRVGVITPVSPEIFHRISDYSYQQVIGAGQVFDFPSQPLVVTVARGRRFCVDVSAFCFPNVGGAAQTINVDCLATNANRLSPAWEPERLPGPTQSSGAQEAVRKIFSKTIWFEAQSTATTSTVTLRISVGSGGTQVTVTMAELVATVFP